jgi:hypothetical protein
MYAKDLSFPITEPFPGTPGTEHRKYSQFPISVGRYSGGDQ